MYFLCVFEEHFWKWVYLFCFLLKVRFPNIMYDRDTTHDDLIEYDELLQIELPFLAYHSEI